MLLQVWKTPVTRATRDIDLLGKLSNDLDVIKEMVRTVCAVAIEDDGLVFDSGTVATVRIAEDADYEGVRATFRGCFGKMPLAMQMDVGFGDVITPEATPITYPSVLDHPPALLLAYNRETTVAEKFEAMVRFGELNSRMKDFFDVWVPAKNFAFDGPVLADAIRSTFTRRRRDVEAKPVCFTERFANLAAKAAQWQGFIRTSRVDKAPPWFAEVVVHAREFLQPVADAIANQRKYDRQWEAGGPWAKR